jgi:hypothetical protein
MQTEESSLEFTRHALEQAQLRGIPIRIVQAIFANADRSAFVGSGCRSLMVSRKHIDRLKDVIPPADRERMDGVILVIDYESSVIITVLHAHGQKGQRYRRQRNGHPHRRTRRRAHWHLWRS